MGAIALSWSNGLINSFTPGGLYNNASDGSALVVWSVELQIAPSGAAPASYNPLVDFTLAPGVVGGQGLSFAGIGMNASGAATSLDVPVPNVPGGALLVAHITWNPFVGGTLTEPSGWTAIQSNAVPLYVVHKTYYRTASGAEPTSYNWATTGAGAIAGEIAGYTGVDPSNPINAFAVNQGSDTDFIVPALTTSIGGCMYLACVGHNTVGNAITIPPPGLTNRAVQNVSMFYDTIMPGATIGTKTVTMASSDPFAATALALSPLQKSVVLASARPMIAGTGAPWGQSLVVSQGTSELGALYYTAPCATSAPTTSPSRWQWPHEYPFCVIPPGQALMANLTQVSNAWLSIIYEVTKYY
jgi:hypothetical protein